MRISIVSAVVKFLNPTAFDSPERTLQKMLNDATGFTVLPDSKRWVATTVLPPFPSNNLSPLMIVLESVEPLNEKLFLFFRFYVLPHSLSEQNRDFLS